MMEQSLQGEVMKIQDLPDVVVTVSKNPHGYKLAWDFLRANWHTLIKKWVGGGRRDACPVGRCNKSFLF